MIHEQLKHLAVPIDSLVEDPRNARDHDERNLAAIRSSLEKFGQRQPIVVQKQGRVIRAGNARWRVAKSLGWQEIAAIVVDEGEAEAVAYAIADNRTAELATWNIPNLVASFDAVGEFSLPSIGFDLRDERTFRARAQAEVVEDEVPEVRPEAISKTGDLFELGGHRLLCGDSTNAEDVARLMGGEKAGLMNTDPPYGVGYANDERPNPGVAKPRVAKPRVANDEFKDDELQAFLEQCFRAALSVLAGNAAWYLWHAHLTQGFFAAAAAAASVVLHRQIIWVKPVLLLGRGQYHWKHEPCFMGWVRGSQPPDYAERNQTTVWELGTVTQAERREFDHSTPKPVALFAIPILKHLLPGEIAYEPFSGSGPQIVAAEQLGRRCFAIEIEPRYVDVAVRRWRKLTGGPIIRNGEDATAAFDDLASG